MRTAGLWLLCAVPALASPPTLDAAREAMRSARWSVARELLLALREAAPDDALIRNELGVALFQEGAYRAAVTELERSTSLAPGRANSWANLGEARRRLGALDSAVAAFREAIRLSPGDQTARRGLERCLAELGRPSKAPSPNAASAGDAQPAPPGALLDRARAAILAGELDRASGLLARLLEGPQDSTQSPDPDALALRALLSALRGDLAAARGGLAAALGLDPACPLANEVLLALDSAPSAGR